MHDYLIRHDIESDQTTYLAENISGPANFTADLSRAVFLQVSRTHPPEIFLLEGKTSRQLTQVYKELDGLSAFFIRSGEVEVAGRNGDRRNVMVARGLSAGKAGSIVDRTSWWPDRCDDRRLPTPRTYPVEVYLQHGIAVFSPNFRGSVNYGAPFRMKNALSQGEGDYDDVMTGIDYLVARGIADPDRLGLMGWSYGGYLTASVVTQTNRFKAASIGAPATDWTTYYGQSDGPKEVLWTYFGGTPWEVPQNYAKHSPRSKLKDIRTAVSLASGRRGYQPQCGDLSRPDRPSSGSGVRRLSPGGTRHLRTCACPRRHGAEPQLVSSLDARTLERILC